MIALFAITTFVACTDNNTDTGGMKASTESVQVSELGDISTIVISSPGPWKATVNEEAREWLTVKPATGGGGSGIEVDVATTRYQEGETLEGVVTFALVSGEGQVKVKFQRGKVAHTRNSDSSALAALYNVTQGATSWRLRWDLNAPINTWDSIKTEVINGELRVVEVNLGGVNLSNSKTKEPLPEQLGYLSELRVLDLSQEPHDYTVTGKFNITGSIPLALADLKNLEKLDLAYNELSGPIPVEILNNPKLAVLNLQLNNKLSGQIPAEISNAKALKELRLASNSFEGIIPGSLMDLSGLEVLDISRNKLSGAVPNFGVLKNLNRLDISYNAKYITTVEATMDKESFTFNVYSSGGFTGSVEIADFPNLTYVNLAGCNFKTSPKVNNCPKINDLYLADNAIGALDASIFNLPSCANFYLDNAGITSLPEVTDMSNAQNLYLQHNYIKEIPLSLKKATKLVRMYLGTNDFEVLPDIFGDMKAMEDFQMAYGKERGDVKEDEFKGKVKSVPASLWTMPSLKILLIHMNRIEGQLPARLTDYAQMVTFNISFNRFDGSIHAIADLKRAEWVLITANKFNSTLPENFGDMRQISALGADDNYLTGGLPASMAKCPSLGTVHLFNNCLDGVVPYEVFSDERWQNKWYAPTYILPQRDGFGLTVQITPPKNN